MFECKIVNIFLSISFIVCFGAQKNRFKETVHVSLHLHMYVEPSNLTVTQRFTPVYTCISLNPHCEKKAFRINLDNNETD